MNDDDRADWRQQQDDERRQYEESIARYRAAHPLWDKCRKHPERLSVDPGVCTLQFCAECLEDQGHAYVERMIRADLERHDTGRVSGMGHNYREVNIGSYDSPRIEHMEYP